MIEITHPPLRSLPPIICMKGEDLQKGVTCPRAPWGLDSTAQKIDSCSASEQEDVGIPMEMM